MLVGFQGIDNVSVHSITYMGISQIYVEFGGSQVGLDLPPLHVDMTKRHGGNLVQSISTNCNAADDVLSAVEEIKRVRPLMQLT